MSTFPKIGDERFALVPDGGKVGIERSIFVEGGPSHYYDDEAKDFVTVRGEWVFVQRLGPFDTQEDATKYMLERTEAAV